MNIKEKNMKRIFIAILALIMILSCVVACTKDNTPENTDTSESTSEETTTEAIDYNKERYYKLNKSYARVKQIGRTQVVDNGIACDFSASGIAFRGIMSGKITLTVQVEPNQEKVDQKCFFTVYVDGERLPDRYMVSPDQNEIVIENVGEMAEHEVRILKQTEFRYCRSVIESVQIFGALHDAPAEKSRYIEFIGDSITCGFGVLENPNNARYSEVSDGTQAYAFMTAEALDADYSLVSCGGLGIAVAEDDQIVPFNAEDIYPYTSYIRSNTKRYDFKRVPDCVVINLGRNDWEKSIESEYKAGVKKLIEMVRAKYGDVKIVWPYNMMGECCQDWTIAAIDEWCAANNVDRNMIMTIKLPQNNQGGGGHPNLEAQTTAAEQLTEFIKTHIYG